MQSPIDVGQLCDALGSAPLYNGGKLTMHTPFESGAPDMVVGVLYLSKESPSSHRALVAFGKQVVGLAAAGHHLVGLMVPVDFRLNDPKAGTKAGVRSEPWDTDPEFLKWCETEVSDSFFFIPPHDERLSLALPAAKDAIFAAQHRKPDYYEVGGCPKDDEETLPPIVLAINAAHHRLVAPLTCAAHTVVPLKSAVRTALLAGPPLFIPREQRTVMPADLFDTGVHQDKLLMFVFVSHATMGRAFEGIRRELAHVRRVFALGNVLVVMCPCDVTEAGHQAVAAAWGESPVFSFHPGAAHVRAVAEALGVAKFPALTFVTASQGTRYGAVERLPGAVGGQYPINQCPPLYVAGGRGWGGGRDPAGQRGGGKIPRDLLFSAAAIGTLGFAILVALRLGKLEPLRRHIERLKDRSG